MLVFQYQDPDNRIFNIWIRKMLNLGYVPFLVVKKRNFFNALEPFFDYFPPRTRCRCCQSYWTEENQRKGMCRTQKNMEKHIVHIWSHQFYEITTRRLVFNNVARKMITEFRKRFPQSEVKKYSNWLHDECIKYYLLQCKTSTFITLRNEKIAAWKFTLKRNQEQTQHFTEFAEESMWISCKW